MENTLRLYDTLVQVLSQHRNWLDIRHLKTLAWMMVGLIQAQVISLSGWVPYVHSRAQYAQSTARRLSLPRFGGQGIKQEPTPVERRVARRPPG
jgi:hypothetical protein